MDEFDEDDKTLEVKTETKGGEKTRSWNTNTIPEPESKSM